MAYEYSVAERVGPYREFAMSPNLKKQGMIPGLIRGDVHGIDRDNAVATAKETLSNWFGEGFATDIMSRGVNPNSILYSDVPRATIGHQQAQEGRTLYFKHSRPMFKALAESHRNPLRIMFPVMLTNSTSFTFTSRDKILGNAVRLPEGGIAPATSSLNKMRTIELERFGTRSEIDMNLIYDPEAMEEAILENQENTTLIAVNNEARLAFNCLMSEGMRFETAMQRHMAGLQGWVQNTQLLVRMARYRDRIGLIMSWNRENGIESLLSQSTEATMNRIDGSQRVMLTSPNVLGNMRNHEKTRLFYMYRGEDGRLDKKLSSAVSKEYHAVDAGGDETIVVTMLPLPDFMRPLSEGALDYSTGFRGQTFISGYYMYDETLGKRIAAVDEDGNPKKKATEYAYICDFTDGTLQRLQLPDAIETTDNGKSWVVKGKNLPKDKYVPVYVRPQIEVATDSCVLGQSIDGAGVGMSIKSRNLTFVNPSNNNEKISTTYVWWAGAHLPHPERVIILPDVNLVDYNGGGRANDTANAPVGIDDFLDQPGDNIHEYKYQGFWTFAHRNSEDGTSNPGPSGDNAFPSAAGDVPFTLYDGYLVWSQFAYQYMDAASSEVQEFKTEMSCPCAHMTMYGNDKKEVIRAGRSMLNEYDYKENLHVMQSPMTLSCARRIMMS